MQNKLFLKEADICELLEVKQTSAYVIIGNKDPFFCIFFLNTGNKKQSALTKITSIKTNCSSYSL